MKSLKNCTFIFSFFMTSSVLVGCAANNTYHNRVIDMNVAQKYKEVAKKDRKYMKVSEFSNYMNGGTDSCVPLVWVIEESNHRGKSNNYSSKPPEEYNQLVNKVTHFVDYERGFLTFGAAGAATGLVHFLKEVVLSSVTASGDEGAIEKEYTLAVRVIPDGKKDNKCKNMTKPTLLFATKWQRS